jgi:hypothetical protein
MIATTYLAQCRSYFSEESSAEIPFGRLLQQGTQDNGAKLLTAINNRIIGISAFANTYEPGPTAGGIIPKDSVSVLTEGEIWVICEDNFTPASTVYARGIAGAGALGRWKTATDSPNTFQVYGAHFLNSGTAGQLARLYFNLENLLAH